MLTINKYFSSMIQKINMEKHDTICFQVPKSSEGIASCMVHANVLVLVAEKGIVAGKARESEEWHGNEKS